MKFLFYLAVVIALAVLGYFIYNSFLQTPSLAKTRIKIGQDVYYNIEIRDNPLTRAKGLSGRESLPSDTGMLFIFDGPAIQSFWMKDMNFDLDFVWIRDYKVVGISQNIPSPANNNGEVYRLSSPEQVDMVLEINAGQISEQGIKLGDLVDVVR